MKKLLGVALLGVVAVAPVQGQVVSNICGSNADGSVCGAAHFTLSNPTTLEVRVFNGTTAATALTPSSISELYFFGVPFTSPANPFVSALYYNYESGAYQPIVNISSIYTYTTNGEGWMIGFTGGLDGAGNAGITTCGGPSLAGVHYATCRNDGGPIFGNASDYVLFTFNLSQTVDLDDIAWGFHAQAVNNLNSLKCVSALGSKQTGAIGANADNYCAETDIPCIEGVNCEEPDPCIANPRLPGCSGGPDATVPEPATMTLLATGLAGLAAAKRRRQNGSKASSRDRDSSSNNSPGSLT